MTMTRVARPNHQPPVLSIQSLLLALTILIATTWIYASNGSQTTNQREAVQVGTVVTTSTSTTTTSEIITGTVNQIPYYHCGSSNSGSSKHLVLLHGAAFTKEDWKTSGILDQFCQTSGLSVSAMDLPVSAKHADLMDLLTAMQQKEGELLVQLPVALVTPSASGKTITDWIMTGNVSKIPQYVSKWIPVAAGSVSSASDEQLKSLEGNLPVFAIYGNQDTMGRKVTNRLASLLPGSCETLELEGRHPCYLDSPDAFVRAVVKDLGL